MPLIFIFAPILFKAINNPLLVGLTFIFSSVIFESLFINAATIKNELLDKSAGTSIFFGVRSFLPFIIISEVFPIFFV